MSQLNFIPSNRILPTASYDRAVASSTAVARTVTPSTRPPAVSISPSAFNLVQEWKTMTLGVSSA
jgi:hypothetical protein